ncbi:MAG: ferredoxin [Gaiella sp.]
MKIVHDTSRCGLHGQCVIAAPKIFRFGPTDALEFEAAPGEGLRTDAEAAVDVCPERALSIVEDDDADE